MTGGSDPATISVLLIEPDDREAALLEVMLGEGDHARFQVTRTGRPDDVSGVPGAAGFDVALLSVPRFDDAGDALLRRLLAARPGVAAVILCGEESEYSAVRAMQRGAQEFLPRAHANARMLSRTLRYAHERRRSLEALADSEARFRRLAENAQDLIYRIRLHPDFAYEYVSPAAQAMIGYTPEEHYADPGIGWKIIHPEDRARLEALTRGEVPVGPPPPLQWLHRDGRVVWTQHRLVPIRDAQGRMVAIEGIARDITAQVREREQLRHVEQQLTLSNRLESVGRLAGGVAHDFNNILTTILGYAELLLDRIQEADPSHRLIREIHKAGQRATALTQQLLAFSRRQLLQPRVLDLNAEIRELRGMLERVLGEDVEIVVALDPDPGRIRADPTQIEQVLLNLVVNARDAMPQGGKLTIETAGVVLDEDYARRHVAVRPGPYVRVTVSDTGIGMDREVQSHIFEPFFTTKEKGKGTGLGLSTVYGVVKQSGGNIWVYSEPGQGTTFKLYLPRVDKTGEPIPAEAATLPVRGGHETILLVEDESGVRDLATEILAGIGYRVLTARDGQHALEVAAAHAEPIHLLVTDVVMPRVGGRALADRLRPMRPDTRILFMSGYTEDAIIQHGLLVSGIAFLEKPFTPARLAGKVREVLDGPPQSALPVVV
jgi:PAS domain S-box-containing protein